MAEVAEKEETQAQKQVAYKLTAALGDNAAGDVVHLPEKAGNALVKAGLAALAGADDISGASSDDDTDSADAMPMVANSVASIGQKIEKATADAVAKVMDKVAGKAPAAIPTVAATVKDSEIYKSNGHYIADIVRATWKGDQKNSSRWNRINAYQEKSNKLYSDMGVQFKTNPLGIEEGVNASAGYTVNPQFSKDIYTIPHNQLDLLSLCVPIEAQSNVLNQRYINESSLANSSIFGGLDVVATAEGNSFTSSLPAWANVTLTLQKLAVFVYYTSEVLEDTSYPLESEINEYVNKAFLYALNTQVVQGTTLEGALNAPSAISVTHSSNDTAFHTTPSTALTYADLCGIWNQVYPDSQASPNGVWLIHPALIQCLTQMTYTFSGSSPAWGIQYNAEAGLSGQGAMTPYMIFGKKCYAHWACSAPGTSGDVMYVDFGTFRHYRKPFRVEVSKEYQFGTDQIAVRFVARLDCKTIFRNTVTGPTGSTAFSPIVTRSSSGT